jgi:hypothetical protein
VSSSPIRSDDDEVRQRHHHLQHQSQGFGKLSKAELFRRQQIYPAGQKLLHGIVATNYASPANKDCIVNIQIRVVNSRLHQVIQRAHMGTQSMDTFSTMQDSVNWHLVVKPSLHLAHRPVVLDCQGKLHLAILIALGMKIQTVKLSVQHFISDMHLLQLIIQIISLGKSLRRRSATASTHHPENFNNCAITFGISGEAEP